MVEIPPELVAYIVERDRQHAEEVEATVAALTDRERQLVREAAVMGYVQGVMATARASDDMKVPPDRDVLWRVIGGCRAYSDLYPLLGGQTAAPTPEEGAPDV